MADVVVPEASGAAPVARDRSRMRGLRTLVRNKSAVIGIVILLLFAFLALAAPLLTPYEPSKQVLESAFEHPTRAHPLGTDNLGRDILARIMYGGRYTLTIGILAVVLATAVGVPLGLVSGYFGGWVDMVIQRIADIMLSFNPFLLALLLVAVIGVGLKSVIIAAGIGVLPQFIRLARGQALSLREEVYVQAADAFGASRMNILRRHILRNSLTPIVVFATLNVGLTILVAAGLGFLGLGVQPPSAEWGTMLGEGREYIFYASYTSTFPGLAIFLVVLGFNLAGDGLRDALDPSLRA